MKVEKGYHPELDEVQYRITLSEDETDKIVNALDDEAVSLAMGDLQYGYVVAELRNELVERLDS